MKYLIPFLLLPLMSFSQNKGASPIAGSQEPTAKKNTYAVVVGISDYQDDKIPDLRYADKDAEAFANFLRSPAGGSLDGDHLKVLTNRQATVAQFAMALDWLMEQAREGDNAIIYFSGHGDVEKKTLTQPGFLLCWDAPSRVYMAGGAFALPMLQEVVSTLSIQNKAKVTVIADACRSGTLAGQSIGGSQATAANLARQYANEIKILSCQPNEYSIEGVQWGGGRGAFSYHLVNALYGLADGNGDLFITLQEAGRYLEDHVTTEVAPVSQVPMVLGNRTERLANVDSKLLADLRSGKTSQMAMLSPVEMRGLEEDVLADLDSSLLETYELFNRALKEKVFLQPEGKCADFYYRQLVAEIRFERLHSTMTRNYAAALQDDAQQVLNTMLKSGLTKEVLTDAKASRIYIQYPEYLQRASELLGKDHYMFKHLQARKHFFEGKIASTPQKKQQAFRQALAWQPEMPHALTEMINTFDANQLDSAYLYFKNASAQVPGWVVPYICLASYFEYIARKPELIEDILVRAGNVDSNSVLVWYQKAMNYERQEKYKEAEQYYLKAIAGSGDEICFPCAYINLSYMYSHIQRYAQAEQASRKAIQLDSNAVYAYHNLGSLLCEKLQRYEEAEAVFKKSIQLDSNSFIGYFNLGNVYFKVKRYKDAEVQFKKAIQLNSRNRIILENLSLVYLETNQYKEAEEVLKKAIAIDSNSLWSLNRLALVYTDTRRFSEAEMILKKIIQIDSSFAPAYINLGNVYSYTGRLDDAESSYGKAIQINPRDGYSLYGLVCILSIRGEIDKAFRTLESALDAGYDNYSWMQNDADLAPMRSRPEWKTLMKKHFPDQIKD